jgi:hypothetical protein
MKLFGDARFRYTATLPPPSNLVQVCLTQALHTVICHRASIKMIDALIGSICQWRRKIFFIKPLALLGLEGITQIFMISMFQVIGNLGPLQMLSMTLQILGLFPVSNCCSFLIYLLPIILPLTRSGEFGPRMCESLFFL